MIPIQQSQRRLSLKIWLYFLLLFTTASALNAQISGTVFLDGNNNGTKDAIENGFPFMTVRAYTTGNTLISTATTAANGTYSLSGLTAGTRYRIEFATPSGYYDGANGSSSATSVRFVTANATNINYGMFVIGKCGAEANPKMIGTNALVSGGSLTKSVISWNYQTDFYAQDHWGGVPYGSNVTHPHNEDIAASAVGVPWQMAKVANTKLIAMVALNI